SPASSARGTKVTSAWSDAMDSPSSASPNPPSWRPTKRTTRNRSGSMLRMPTPLHVRFTISNSSIQCVRPASHARERNSRRRSKTGTDLLVSERERRQQGFELEAFVRSLRDPIVGFADPFEQSHNFAVSEVERPRRAMELVDDVATAQSSFGEQVVEFGARGGEIALDCRPNHRFYLLGADRGRDRIHRLLVDRFSRGRRGLQSINGLSHVAVGGVDERIHPVVGDFDAFLAGDVFDVLGDRVLRKRAESKDRTPRLDRVDDLIRVVTRQDE